MSTTTKSRFPQSTDGSLKGQASLGKVVCQIAFALPFRREKTIHEITRSTVGFVRALRVSSWIVIVQAEELRKTN